MKVQRSSPPVTIAVAVSPSNIHHQHQLQQNTERGARLRSRSAADVVMATITDVRESNKSSVNIEHFGDWRNFGDWRKKKSTLGLVRLALDMPTWMGRHSINGTIYASTISRPCRLDDFGIGPRRVARLSTSKAERAARP
jgi:hypothetical protein